MALWNKVQTGFNADDETINFGTRIITENNGSLYEACTIATIQSREKVDEKPTVLASLQYSKFCVAIDKSITIFEDEMCNKILYNVSFPSMIVRYCISKDGFFLFVVLATKILYCLHLSDGKQIFTKTIPDNNQDNIIQIFLKEQSEEVLIILVMNTGVIYSFSKFYPKTLEIALTNDDKAMIAEHITNIECSQLFKGFTSEKFFNAMIDELSDNLSITMIGTNSVFIWPNDEYNNFYNVFSFGYKKIQSLFGSNKMLCLRTDYTLTIMCPNTLLGLKIYDGPVFDFIVIQHNNINHCEILFLTQSKQNPARYLLRLISYPDLEQKLEINVSTTIYLLEVLHTSNNIFYIEGISTDNKVINEFRIKTISESIPEMRLARLLKKKQFDAAEAFARRSDLSLESIYCAKAASFIEQFCTKSTPDLISVNALINVLDKIQNVQYVTDCCSKIFISNYTQMRQIYLYAQQRIMQNIKRENMNDSLNAILSLINDNLYRLETFQMIQYTEENTLLNYDTDMKEWIRFLQANLLEECTTYLCMGHLKSATLIWTRHLPDIVKHISMKTVQNIFAILPEDMTPSCLWPWLTHFIPTLLSLLPDTIDEIISWSLKKLKQLEISYCTVWPEIGIDFAKKFLKLLKFEDGQQSICFYQEYRYQNSLLKQLIFLLQVLSDIQQLKNIYRLRVPLDTYIDLPIEAIHMLLDKVNLDKISNFVNTFLKQYILNNNLQNDAVLCTYIQKTMKSSDSWWFNEEAIWEKRVTIIIELIHNIEDRLKQTLTVLRKAPVPWSSTIITLAETNSNFDHELSFEIKVEYDYVPIKVILKKYGYATIGVNNKLISRIIKEDRDSVINDIDTLTKRNQQLRQDAFCRYINFQLKIGNLQKAVDTIYYLENNITDVLYCYEGILNYIVAVSSFQNATTSLIYHIKILDCLKFKIHDLLAQSNICSFRYNNIVKMIKDLKSLYTLKKNYKIDILLKDYHMQKSVILQNYITKFLSNMKEDDLSVIYKTVIKVAEVLGLEKSCATLSLLKQTKNVNILPQLVSYDDEDLNISDDFKYIYKICLLALQHAEINIDTIKVVKDLSASILNICQDSDLKSAVILYTYIRVCSNFFTQHYSNIKQEIVPQFGWKLYTIYKDQAVILDKRLLFLFNDGIYLYLYYSNQVNDNEITNCNEQLEDQLNNFLENVKKMRHQHNDYSLLQIFKTFYFMYCNISVRNKDILMKMESVLFQLLMNLLKKLCIERSFDLQLGLSCLFMLPESEAYTWLSTTCTFFQADYIRHCTISTLGYEYSRLRHNRSLQMFEDYKLLHIWAQKLSHYSIAYKEVLINNASSKREILMQIISSNMENIIPLLKDYCCNFGFNFDDCLILYLEILLKTWNPTIIMPNGSMYKELLICKNEIDELRKKCNEIVAQLSDEFMVKQCISSLWNQVNFYYYEVFIILMDLTGNNDMKERNYLYFLQNYTRSGSPTQIEHDKWIQLNPGHSTLPPIAQWRLPFLFKDIWKIITPELNLRTYDKWLDIAPILKLETHLICTLAIKGEVTRVWGNNSTKSKNATWSLCLRNTTLLQDIKKCIQQITNSDGFYYGTAALYYVVNHTPAGADCVAAAKECYEYAQLAAQNSTKFEKGMLEKIKYKYLRFTSEHILRTYGLEKDKYLALIENPYKLVYELYNDESIPLRYRTTTNHRPNINAAVNELGKLFSLNIIKLRLDLLQEWLQSDVRCTELCQSFTQTFLTLKDSDQNTDYEDNLFRTCYMLEYGDVELFAQFLINIGFGDQCGQAEYNYNVQYRALRILQNIVDTATLEKLTQQDICTFRKYMKSLHYISKLELLGLCYSVNSFETCSKHDLVQILLKSQRHSSYALSLIAQICIEFEIYDILFWDDTLSQMTKLRMMSELKKVLLQSRSEKVIVSCNGYKMGWQLIISEPFREINVNSNLQQIDSCIEAICLLYSCPVTHELNFTTIVKNCFQCKQASLAAALLPFLNESDKKFVLEMVNQKCQMAELIEELNNLSSKGILTVAHSLTILQESTLQE